MFCLMLYGFAGRIPPAATPEAPPPGWLPLSQVRERFGLDLADGAADRVVLTREHLRLTFLPGGRRLLVDDLSVWLNAPLVYARGDWLLSVADVESTLEPLLTPARQQPAALRVMLDPGHGGEDGGTVSLDGALLEKNIVLEIALAVATNLVDRGMAVALTRADDRFIALSERSALAAAWPADLFVSIHVNAAENRHARGAETFIAPADGFPATVDVLSGAVPEIPAGTNNAVVAARNTLLGYAVHRKLPLRRLDEADRGLRRARYQVLTQAPCPAVLIECGFLSNSQDADRLGSPDAREVIARAIAEGIIEYARRIPLLAAAP